jgi:hypothetical protein
MPKKQVRKKVLASKTGEMDVFSEVMGLAESKVNIPLWARNITDYAAKWGIPTQIGQQCVKARLLVEGSGDTRPCEFVREPFEVRLGMFLDGFHIGYEMLGDTPEAWTSAKEKLLKRAPWFEGLAASICADAMREFSICSNAAVMWIDNAEAENGAPAVTVIDTESIVSYSNGAGGDFLKVRVPKASQEAIQAGALDGYDERWKNALNAGGDLNLDREQGDNFHVATNAKEGKGLARVQMMGLLEIIGFLELIALSDHSGAWEARNVIRQIMMGHEIKYGPKAGYGDHFIKESWVKRAKEVLKKQEGGPFNFFTNFDWVIKHAFLEPKFFDKTKYEGGLQRLSNWWGAVSAMGGGEVSDGVWERLRAEVKKARDIVGGLVERVINDPKFLGGTKLKGRLKVGFNPLTCMSQKQRLETVRFATSQGVMSNSTARLVLGLDSAIEGRRILAERAKLEENTPYFEKNQGQSTAEVTTEAGGRPQN